MTDVFPEDPEELIPHRGRMRLVERVVGLGEGWLESATRVASTWPTCDDSAVEALVLVEVLAQTAALLTGWERRDIEAQGGRGGLVGVRRAHFAQDRVPVGTELLARVTVLRRVQGYRVFEGRVTDGTRTLCDGELQAMRPDAADAGEFS